MFSWLNQVLSVASYSVRTIPERLGSSLSAAVGIAGVVAVLVGMLSIAEGFKRAMARAGADDVAIVLRSGNKKRNCKIFQMERRYKSFCLLLDV